MEGGGVSIPHPLSPLRQLGFRFHSSQILGMGWADLGEHSLILIISNVARLCARSRDRDEHYYVPQVLWALRC